MNSLFQYSWLTFAILLFACQKTPETTDKMSPQQIIDHAIEAHGGKAYQNMYVKFRFRDKEYSIQKTDSSFRYTRTFSKEEAAIMDQLTDTGFLRKINGEVAQIEDTMARKYANSVNSVAYFALLPAPLNDPAVIKKSLGQSVIKGKDYHKIQITFQEEGGGDDFDDVFIFWIHTETFYVDYLAYEFQVDGGGLRFREAYHPQNIGGIRWQDYVNYKAEQGKHKVQELDKLFEQGQLEELSKIELKEFSTETF